MPFPIYRLEVPYTIVGVLHKLHLHFKDAVSSGGDYLVWTRTTNDNTLNWHDAVDGLVFGWNAIMSSDTSLGTSLLQEFGGDAWNTIADYVKAGTPTGTAAVGAEQLTLTLRDALFKRTKVVLMETIEPGLQHVNTPTGGDAAMDTFVSVFTGTHANVKDPYNWVASIRDVPLSTNCFVMVTTTFNRRLRKARGML